MRKTPLTPGRFGIVLIKGAGDLGSGVAYRLWRCGFQVVMTELAQPLCVRRAVCFAEAVYAGETTVEGITARRVHTLAAARAALSDDVLPLLVTPDPGLLAELTPTVVVDAIMAKANSGTQITDAPLVIALGPGFTADHDCHAIVETHRGHTLGRVLWKGQALPDTGTPGPIEGYTATRVLRAPIEGYVVPLRAVGEHIKAGEILARVSPQPASEQESRCERSFRVCYAASFTHPCSCRPAAKLATWIHGVTSVIVSPSRKNRWLWRAASWRPS